MMPELIGAVMVAVAVPLLIFSGGVLAASWLHDQRIEEPEERVDDLERELNETH